MPVTSAVFSKYLTPSKKLVETGTAFGDGLIQAMAAGFTEVYSIEVYKPNFDFSSKRFADDKRVHLYFGASNNILLNILKEVGEQCTLWLDGHWSGAGTGKDGDLWNPIWQELGAIQNCGVSDHTILIDDRRLFSSDQFCYISEKDIKDKILQINPKYKFSYEDGFCKDDILVAKVEE